MRAAEDCAIAEGTSAEALMERAGIAAAEAIRRFAGPLPALVLCGPGNNGGDGYVVARALAEAGSPVRVAALAEPKTIAAAAARARWTGEVAPLAEAEPAPLLVDALFGTGLARRLDEPLALRLGALAGHARVSVALDLPSGAATDDGSLLSPVPDFDLTIAFGSLKPSHLLQPAARRMGRIVVANIGIAAQSALFEIARPILAAPGPADHKYSRGYVVVAAGGMPGAARLAATGALRGGAGYVHLVSPNPLGGLPAAVVESADAAAAFADPRVGAIVVGPGLGRSAAAGALLAEAARSAAPLVADGDALTLAAVPDFFHRCARTPILTPHAGEFARLFGEGGGSKVEEARRAAAAARSVVVCKGADTVVAAPDGRAAIASAAVHWLATAGTGDVLAGIVGATRARGLEAFEAACAGVWLHARAAELAGPALIADDLPSHLPVALRQCL
jgi:hydroxyethylthiazole kinase-like uncharacterized protein yjeF